LPEIISELVDEPDAHPDEPGSKGPASSPIILIAAAIANAIRATGANVRRLPISREEMLRAREAVSTRGRKA
jgi:CO/xanthine dehydrogenase Mo-binding subunit